MCDAQEERGEQDKAWRSLPLDIGYLRSHGSSGLSYYVPTAAWNLSFDNYSLLAAGKALGRRQRRPSFIEAPKRSTAPLVDRINLHSSYTGGAIEARNRITFRIDCSVCAGVFVRVRSHGRLFGRLIALVLHRDWNGHRRRAEKPVRHPAESSEQPADEIRELLEGFRFSDVDFAGDRVSSCAP